MATTKTTETTLLVLGGSHFAGHAVVAEARRRGWRVTTFNRGHSPASDQPGVERLHGDRADPGTLAPTTPAPSAAASSRRRAPSAIVRCSRVPG